MMRTNLDRNKSQMIISVDRIDLNELEDLLIESFEDLIKGKSDENRQIIKKLIQSLARDLMQALDTRKEGVLDVRENSN